jgi:hypothetical protein
MGNAPNVTHAHARGDAKVHLVPLAEPATTLCGLPVTRPLPGSGDPTCDPCILEYRRLAGADRGGAEGGGMRLGELTDAEVALLREALDSHIYWQLSDEHYRDSGFVSDPGSDEPDKAAEIAAANALDRKLAGEAGGDG